MCNTGKNGETRLTADVREDSKKAVRMINLAKGRYAKNPTEELKPQILDRYSKLIVMEFLKENIGAEFCCFLSSTLLKDSRQNH